MKSDALKLRISLSKKTLNADMQNWSSRKKAYLIQVIASCSLIMMTIEKWSKLTLG